MNPVLKISKSININSVPSLVWDALINPAKIKQYFTGAETITDWKVGSQIIFTHTYVGKVFINKGVILDFDSNRLLRYTYWTPFSNTEDKPENYTIITYFLTDRNDSTNLMLTQTNLKNEEWYLNLEIGWNTVLSKIKDLVEGPSL